MNPLSNLWVYNHVPIDLDCGKDYVQRCSDKPDGLWVSVGRDWARWCEEERFRSRGGGLKVRHKVRLGKRDSILLLQSTADIVSFTNKYREVLYKTERDNPYCWGIEWSSVAENYDGIVISPYNWHCRNNSHTWWYYGWDCASGCIWNLSAIESVWPVYINRRAVS